MTLSDLLANPLIVKFFPCPLACHDNHNCADVRALQILHGMQEPIKKGDKYVGYFFSSEEWHLSDAPQDNNDPYHPGMLRIPDSFQPKREWLDPTPEMLKTPLFNAIWGVIKSWDINVPSAYNGYCGATGNHVRAIMDAIKPPSAAGCGCPCHKNSGAMNHLVAHCPCKKPETAKCDKAGHIGHHAATNCTCICCVQPDRDVEEKIQVIVELHDDKKPYHLASLETRLRELVRLARGGK